MAETAVLPVRVCLFARYAELLGASEVTVRIPLGGTVADVADAVRALPGGSSLPERMLVACGVNQVGYDHPVVANSEFALLPPMSGG